MDKVVYRQQLLAGNMRHPVFHVSQLKRAPAIVPLHHTSMMGDWEERQPRLVLDHKLVERNNQPLI